MELYCPKNLIYSRPRVSVKRLSCMDYYIAYTFDFHNALRDWPKSSPQRRFQLPKRTKLKKMKLYWPSISCCSSSSGKLKTTDWSVDFSSIGSIKRCVKESQKEGRLSTKLSKDWRYSLCLSPLSHDIYPAKPQLCCRWADLRHWNGNQGPIHRRYWSQQPRPRRGTKIDRIGRCGNSPWIQRWIRNGNRRGLGLRKIGIPGS